MWHFCDLGSDLPPSHQIQEAMLEGTGLSNSVLACGVVLAELGTVQRFLAVCSSAQAVNLKSEFFLSVPQCAGFSTPWRSSPW